MNFYNNMHPYYCGIDLHARILYVCIIDQLGEILVHKFQLTLKNSLKSSNPTLAISSWVSSVCIAGIGFLIFARIGQSTLFLAMHCI